MNIFKAFAICLLTFSFACQSITPTPILMVNMDNLNTEVNQLYLGCSEGANYVPEKEGCRSVLLLQKVNQLLDLSQEFISADIKQPQGYDIHLHTATLRFRIKAGDISGRELTEKELIARQFFETQKASSGMSINTAKFYWAWFVAENAAYQFHNDPLALTETRKAELLLALGEGISLLNKLEGPRLVRLQQALEILKFVTDSIQ